MLFRRLGALAAAFSIAFIPLASKAADSATAPTPGMTDSVIDAQAQMDALKDIPANSWAYQAIVDLVNDGIIVGYPDGTFKGARPLTRYEAAVLVERAVQYLTKKLANPATAPQVTQADIDKLRALLDEFKGDIDSLKLRVSDIDDRLKRVEATQDRAKLGLVYLIRPGNFHDQVSAFQANGAPTAANAVFTPSSGNTPTGPGGNVSQNRYITGNTGTGYGYQLIRVLLDGNLDKKTSYHIRVENVYNWDTSDAYNTGSFQGATTTAANCATAATTGCGLTVGSNGSAAGGAATSSPNYVGGTYPRNTGVRLNYAYAQYNDPNGLLVEAGRINETDGTLGLAWADQFNGGEIGYVKGPVNIRAGYFFDYPSLNNIAGVSNSLAATTCKAGINVAPTGGAPTVTNTTPGATGANGVTQPSACGVTTQTILATAQFQPTKTVTVGVAYEDDINSVVSTWDPSVCAVAGSGQQCTLANYLSACPTYLVPGSAPCQPYGLYEPSIINVSVGTAFGRYANPNLFKKGSGLSLEAEGLLRFGNDPFTGTGWQQNLAYWFQGKIGSYAPKPYTAYVEGGYVNAGFNSLNSHNAVVNGTNYEGQFLGNVNGYQIGYAGIQYWFSNYGRIGVVYNMYDLRNGTTYPVSSTTCPGCFLTHDYGQALFLQTYLSF
jgi:hypothetical protein